jgi:Arc/MetJ-type ribon-helix-helix transcriptional regulator
MTITLKPETERLIQEELQSGHFHSVDEIIVQGVQALRENKTSPQAGLLNMGHPRKTKAEAAEHIRQSRRGNRLHAGMTIRDLINEGRA